MSKLIKYCFAVVCAVCMLVASAGVYAHAAEDEGREPVEIPYVEIPMYIDDVYIGSGMKLDDTTYVPLVSFCELVLNTDCEAAWDQELELVELETDGLSLSLVVTDNFMEVNGRCIYLPNGAYNMNGTIVVPIRELGRVFQIELSWDEETWSIDLDTDNAEVFESGDMFYDEEELYWLSRVISSESGNQPLEGMIGVGNVVQNRVLSESFPNTIQEVVFQPGQFSVVDNGTINIEPRECAVIAAKICLEGYNTVGDSLYFHNPTISRSTWFAQHKVLCAVIADHEFYA